MDPKSGHVTPDSLFAAASTGEIAAAMAEAGAVYPHAELTGHLDRFFIEGASQSVAVTNLAHLFERLKARGLKLGIASSDNETSIRTMAERFGILSLLDYIAGYDSGHGVKPGPGMVHGFAKATGLAPEEIAMVGDNTHDLHMARNAKAGLAVGVLTGTGTRASLESHADHVLASIEDLENLLESLPR
jgi:phosphoglycolate phosphatase